MTEPLIPEPVFGTRRCLRKHLWGVRVRAPLWLAGRRRRASSCCADGKSEARSGHRPGRAHAASGPQSWASNRAVLINMTLYQPGERIRASPLCLSKTQLDAEATLVSAPGPPQSLDLVEPPVCGCPATAFSGRPPRLPSSPKPPFLWTASRPSRVGWRTRQGSRGEAGAELGPFGGAGGGRGGWASRAAWVYGADAHLSVTPAL